MSCELLYRASHTSNLLLAEHREGKRECIRVADDKNGQALWKPVSFYNLFFKMIIHHFYLVRSYCIPPTIKKKLYMCVNSLRQQSLWVISVAAHYRLPSDNPEIHIPPTKYTHPYPRSLQISSHYSVSSKYCISLSNPSPSVDEALWI